MKQSCEVLVAGGGLGGVAAALGAAAAGCSVVLLEENKWLGGQITAQGVSALDEHALMERFGGTASYYQFRQMVRRYYTTKYRLSSAGKQAQHFNPGWSGEERRLAFEPTAAVEVMEEMLAAAASSGCLEVRRQVRLSAVSREGNNITRVSIQDCKTGKMSDLYPAYVIDATELGDLLELASIPYRTGVEAFSETREPSAPQQGIPQACQAFNYTFALEWRPGSANIIDKPELYEELRKKHTFSLHAPKMGIGEKGVSFWSRRQIIDADNFDDPEMTRDVVLVNCMSTDYREETIIDREPHIRDRHLYRAKQLALSYLYWLQTEAPRDGGGYGYPELCLRPDLMGTDDGLAQYPYIREARRLRSLYTIKEQDIVAYFNNGGSRARFFYDSVGIGWYLYIDIHWCCHTKRRSGSGQRLLPFQIPLGALITDSAANLIAAAKNIGTTHITNGAYRLHPVEWNIGESAGLLAGYAVKSKKSPRAIFDNRKLLQQFQLELLSRGIPLYWYDDVPVGHRAFTAVQYLAMQGIIPGYSTHLHFFPDRPLQQAVGSQWIARAKLRFIGLRQKLTEDLHKKIGESLTQAEFARYLFNVIRKLEQ